MKSVENSSRQFFKRLDRAQDYELSEKALKMDVPSDQYARDRLLDRVCMATVEHS